MEVPEFKPGKQCSIAIVGPWRRGQTARRHLTRNIGFTRLRLRGLHGAEDEILPAEPKKSDKNGSLFAAVSRGIAICPSGVMVLSEVTVIVLVRAS